MASPTTIDTKLYENALRKKQIAVVVPLSEQMQIIEQAIRSVIAEKSSNKDVKQLTTIANNLLSNGAESVLFGCTELSLLFANSNNTLHIDPLTIITEKLV